MIVAFGGLLLVAFVIWVHERNNRTPSEREAYARKIANQPHTFSGRKHDRK